MDCWILTPTSFILFTFSSMIIFWCAYFFLFLFLFYFFCFFFFFFYFFSFYFFYFYFFFFFFLVFFITSCIDIGNRSMTTIYYYSALIPYCPLASLLRSYLLISSTAISLISSFFLLHSLSFLLSHSFDLPTLILLLFHSYFILILIPFYSYFIPVLSLLCFLER